MYSRSLDKIQKLGKNYGVMIDWQNKILLDCSNSIFSGLYEDILNVIYEQKLSFNNECKKT